MDVGDLFGPSMRYTWSDGGPDCEMSIVSAGEVSLPTGALVVADPAWVMTHAQEENVVAARIRPAEYAVKLWVATWPWSPNPRLPSPMSKVCAAKLQISDREVVRWIPARPTKDEPSKPMGISVDSGLAAFFDFSSKEWISALQDDEERFSATLENLKRDLFVSISDERTGGNAVIFECGMGDGVYDVWLGLAEDGGAAEVVIDLELLSHSDGPAA